MITVHVITYVPLTGQANLEDKIKNLQDNLQNIFFRKMSEPVQHQVNCVWF